MSIGSQVKIAPPTPQPAVAKPRLQGLAAPTVETSEAPAIDAQQETAARLGHSFGAISVLPPDPPIQPKRARGMTLRLSPFHAQLQRKPNPAPVIPAGWAVLQRQPTPANEEASAEEEKTGEATPLQTKLEVGKPDDPYEQEADHVADQVMRMPEAEPAAEPEALQAKPFTTPTISHIQRQAADETQAEDELQPKEQPGQTPTVTPDLEARVQASQGKGQPLPPETRAFMEPRFGHDFGQVRVHADGEAADMNRALQAQAFTHKQDLFFGAGKYSPEAGEGKRLLAHELTHVVQQVGSQIPPASVNKTFSKIVRSPIIQAAQDESKVPPAERQEQKRKEEERKISIEIERRMRQEGTFSKEELDVIATNDSLAPEKLDLKVAATPEIDRNARKKLTNVLAKIKKISSRPASDYKRGSDELKGAQDRFVYVSRTKETITSLIRFQETGLVCFENVASKGKKSQTWTFDTVAEGVDIKEEEQVHEQERILGQPSTFPDQTVVPGKESTVSTNAVPGISEPTKYTQGPSGPAAKEILPVWEEFKEAFSKGESPIGSLDKQRSQYQEKIAIRKLEDTAQELTSKIGNLNEELICFDKQKMELKEKKQLKEASDIDIQMNSIQTVIEEEEVKLSQLKQQIQDKRTALEKQGGLQLNEEIDIATEEKEIALVDAIKSSLTAKELAGNSSRELCNVISYYLYGLAIGEISEATALQEWYKQEVIGGRITRQRGKSYLSYGSGSGGWRKKFGLFLIAGKKRKEKRIVKGKEIKVEVGNAPLSDPSRAKELEVFLKSDACLAISYQDFRNTPAKAPHHFLLIVKDKEGLWRNMDHTSKNFVQRGGLTDFSRVFGIAVDQAALMTSLQSTASKDAEYFVQLFESYQMTGDIDKDRVHFNALLDSLFTLAKGDSGYIPQVLSRVAKKDYLYHYLRDTIGASIVDKTGGDPAYLAQFLSQLTGESDKKQILDKMATPLSSRTEELLQLVEQLDVFSRQTLLKHNKIRTTLIDSTKSDMPRFLKLFGEFDADSKTAILGSKDLKKAISEFHRDNPDVALPAELQALLTPAKQAPAKKQTYKIQPKLMVGAAHDVYEQEADRVADRVMRMVENERSKKQEPLQTKPFTTPTISHIQRQAADETQAEDELQPKEQPGQVPIVTPDLEARLQTNQGKGQPLSSETRAFMEPRFGHDFAQVRVHADGEAAEMNRALQAQAFTHKQDVFFAAGKYSPEAGEGKWLLAHELTHVVQQGETFHKGQYAKNTRENSRRNPKVFGIIQTKAIQRDGESNRASLETLSDFDIINRMISTASINFPQLEPRLRLVTVRAVTHSDRTIIQIDGEGTRVYPSTIVKAQVGFYLYNWNAKGNYDKTQLIDLETGASAAVEPLVHQKAGSREVLNLRRNRVGVVQITRTVVPPPHPQEPAPPRPEDLEFPLERYPEALVDEVRRLNEAYPNRKMVIPGVTGGVFDPEHDYKRPLNFKYYTHDGVQALVSRTLVGRDFYYIVPIRHIQDYLRYYPIEFAGLAAAPMAALAQMIVEISLGFVPIVGPLWSLAMVARDVYQASQNWDRMSGWEKTLVGLNVLLLGIPVIKAGKNIVRGSLGFREGVNTMVTRGLSKTEATRLMIAAGVFQSERATRHIVATLGDALIRGERMTAAQITQIERVLNLMVQRLPAAERAILTATYATQSLGTARQFLKGVELTERHMAGLRRLMPEVLEALKNAARSEPILVERIALMAAKSETIARGIDNIALTVKPGHLTHVVTELGEDLLAKVGSGAVPITDDLVKFVKRARSARKAYQQLMTGSTRGRKPILGLAATLERARPADQLTANLTAIRGEFSHTYLTTRQLSGLSRLIPGLRAALKRVSDLELRTIANLADESSYAVTAANDLASKLLSANLPEHALGGILANAGAGLLASLGRSGAQLSNELLGEVARVGSPGTELEFAL